MELEARIEELREKGLYEILFRNAGVACLMYDGPQGRLPEDWRTHLSLRPYKPTLDEAVDAALLEADSKLEARTCPTCGSDDPAFKFVNHSRVWDADPGSPWHCSDPFHTEARTSDCDPDNPCEPNDHICSRHKASTSDSKGGAGGVEGGKPDPIPLGQFVGGAPGEGEGGKEGPEIEELLTRLRQTVGGSTHITIEPTGRVHVQQGRMERRVGHRTASLADVLKDTIEEAGPTTPPRTPSQPVEGPEIRCSECGHEQPRPPEPPIPPRERKSGPPTSQPRCSCGPSPQITSDRDCPIHGTNIRATSPPPGGGDGE